MGSLASRPKVPQQSRVVFVPAAAAPATALENGAGAADASENDTNAQSDQSVESSAARAAGLLRQERSRLGTIHTGFRGLLQLASMAGQRKTLLGE